MSKDGARDSPSAGTAENWGRPDRIRAGAVSGPWRSAPRAEHGESGAAPQSRGGAGHGVAAALAKARAKPTGATGRMDGRPQPHAAAPQARQVKPEYIEPDYVEPDFRASDYRDIDETMDRQRRSVRLAIAAGVLIALAIVGAAFLLRPGAGPDVAVPETPAETVTATAPPAAPAPVQAPPAAAEESGAIRLRVGPNLAPERREQIAAALKAEGYGPVVVEVLPFQIAASRVGYYRAEDEAPAAALAQFLSGMLGDGGIEVSTRDYGKLLSDTEPGRLDVWIEG
ncbi:hypothetical protein [Amaricoccus sp.]|uniref:hypothetical protein n=1 Tax=Amaricoccus sp. TaxID=1872485 RepID=UPI002BF9C9D7|nr:hypothetical protein [Amaricoccus sp.]HRW14494.1 hypothetical protein [Amaricoccus sp.]